MVCSYPRPRMGGCYSSRCKIYERQISSLWSYFSCVDYNIRGVCFHVHLRHMNITFYVTLVCPNLLNSNIKWAYSLQELPDVPLFLSLHNLCATLKCTSPSAIMFRSALINAGYRISGTHVNPLGLKSDAPMDVIWDIMRCWVSDHTWLKLFHLYVGSVVCYRIWFFWHVYIKHS